MRTHTLHLILYRLTIALFVGFLYWGNLAVAEAATLRLSPATGVYTAGSTFTVQVVINTEGTGVNAAEGTLSFNPSELSVVSVSRGASIFNLWTQEPSFSNSAGTISFGGGSPTGYTGSAGNVMTVTFRTLNAGSPKVTFSSGSVLAADGRGTNVLRSMSSGAYTIAAAGVEPQAEQIIEYVAPPDTPRAPTVSASNHPDADGWYTSTSTVVSWNLPDGVVAVRTLLDGNPGTVPTVVYEPPIRERALEDLEQGVSYFHVQFKNENGWGRVEHYRLAVDSFAPDNFSIELADADPDNPEQTLVFNVRDATSEVTKYLIQINDDEPFVFLDETASGTYALPPLSPGRHSFIIEAFDQADNSVVATFAFDIKAFEKPLFVEYPTEINEEVIPVIKGTTRPNAKVFVSLHKTGVFESVEAAQSEYEVSSDENGEFVFIPDGRLSLGVYEITAYAIDQFGAQSERSEAIRIAVQQPGFVQIGTLFVNVLSIVVTLLALLVVAILLILFTIRRIKNIRTRVHTEADEALAVFNKEHNRVVKTLEKNTSTLTNSRKTKKLTKAETELIEALHTDLSEMKKRVQKEITDVDEVVE